MKILLLLITLLVSNPGFASMVEMGCTASASTYELLALCIELEVDPLAARHCANRARNTRQEALCLRDSRKLTRKIEQACRRNTSSQQLEAVCLRLRRTPSVSEACAVHASDNRLEELCLKLNIQPEVVQYCREKPNAKQEEQCLLDAAYEADMEYFDLMMN